MDKTEQYGEWPSLLSFLCQVVVVLIRILLANVLCEETVKVAVDVRAQALIDHSSFVAVVGKKCKCTNGLNSAIGLQATQPQKHTYYATYLSLPYTHTDTLYPSYRLRNEAKISIIEMTSSTLN